MSVNSLSLDAARVDYYGDWTAQANEGFEQIADSDCFDPLLVIVPGQGQVVTPASGTVQFNFQLDPGSRIIAAWIAPSTGIFQITDLCNGHELIQDAGSGLGPTGLGPVGEAVSFFLLPCPWVVMGSGLFSFQAWAAPGTVQYVILMVAQVKPC